MSVSVKVTKRTKSVLVGISRSLSAHRCAIRDALHEHGNDVIDENQKLIINGPKTGRIYRFRGRPHQASAQGEPPANRSGVLKDSGGYRVRNPHEMTVGEEAFYAGFLEDGTRKMKPRPHLIRAINNTAQDLINSILENVNKEVKRI